MAADARLARAVQPVQDARGKRLAVMFGVVYFAQGMWYLPKQTITIVLKDRGLSAGQVADFFLITIIPWFIKTRFYGLLSDFVPLFGATAAELFLAHVGAGRRRGPDLGGEPLHLRRTDHADQRAATGRAPEQGTFRARSRRSARLHPRGRCGFSSR